MPSYVSSPARIAGMRPGVLLPGAGAVGQDLGPRSRRKPTARRSTRSHMSISQQLPLAVLVLAALLAAACGAEEGSAPARPNVLIITLDTTRADHLGCYGYERETSPNLDRLAAESTLYTHVISTSSWTLPSHAALFTGKFTASHGARYDPTGPLKLTSGIEGPADWDHYRARGLSTGEVTLAGVLGEAGWRTGAVVAGPWMKRVFGLDVGFEHYDDEQVHSVTGRLASEVTDAALSWLSQPDERPFFLFLNYYDPHSPFQAPAPYTFEFVPPQRHTQRGLANSKNWLDLYDAEILYTDEHVGRLLDELRRTQRFDNTLIVVTSDHGELFGEQGHWGHGEFLTQQELSVPMFIKQPGGSTQPARDDRPMQQVDVMPLVLERLGLPIPAGVQGAARGGEHPLISEVYPLPMFAKTGDWRVLVEGSLKYVWSSQGNHALYDLAVDPLELDNLASERSEVMQAMGARLDDYLASLPAPGEAGPEREVGTELSETLGSLGYMDDAHED